MSTATIGLDPKVKFGLYRFSCWTGIIVLIAATVGFAVVGNIASPPPPSWNADQIAKFMLDNRTGILWCVVIMGFFAPFFYFFATVTSVQIARIEGGWGILSYLQLTTAVVAPTGWVYPLSTLAAGIYRPERSHELMLLISDQFWLTYVGVAFIFSINIWVIGFAALVDRRPNPVFPRWWGWAQMVFGLLFAPGAFIYAFQDGSPFAWNGLFALIIPSLSFYPWKIMTVWGLLRAVKSEEQEESATLSAPILSRAAA
jgi:hypothetical protein